MAAIRRQLGEQQTFMRETLDRLAQTQDENELISRRRDELEQRLQTLEVEYEELLGLGVPPSNFMRLTSYRENNTRRGSPRWWRRIDARAQGPCLGGV